MFCTKCGTEIKNGAKFCTKCGAPAYSPEQNQTVENKVIQETVATSVATQEAGTLAVPAKKKKISAWKIIIPILCILLCALIALGAFYFWNKWKMQAALEVAMEEAMEYMEEQEYEEAIDAYEALLEDAPDNVEAKMALAKAYLCQGDFKKAEKWLDEIEPEEDDERPENYERLWNLVKLEPKVEKVNTNEFPNITIEMSQKKELELSIDNFVIQENGEEKGVYAVAQGDGMTDITYLADDTEINGEERTVNLQITVDGVKYELECDYVTPTFNDADIRLVSADVSQYPVVKAYFRVSDPFSGESISGLDNLSFTIQERLQGGEYLNREVKAATLLKDNAGLNINLVADKSDSISDGDMQKIKNVMKEFVKSLHFEVGDKAELLAFDSIVQQMCYYTDEVNLLINGIDNMSTDGLTAFYDAVYDGITHAALQGGARCVIAFTDGSDNMSRHSYLDVINYACEKQVPVYIIGVGYSVEESTLEYIAENTGGRYWFIDDLYDLEEIFNQVYSEQKELYVVEYESDADEDSYLSRDLQVKVTGNGYRSTAECNFTPVRSINDNGGVDRASRYELIKECLTWEEASRRCQEMGGHLATITSQSEMDELVAMAEAENIKYVWLGGYTSYDNYGNVFGHWVTGENFDYQKWSVGEPSRVDADGEEEWYIMLWNIPNLGGWTWNDQRNDPASAVKSMQDKMGFICEYEN